MALLQKLSPSQMKAYANLEKAFSIGSIVVVWTETGLGKTTILKEFHRKHRGTLLSMKNYVDDLRAQNPFQMEETLESMLMDAFKNSDLVIMDDIHLIYDVTCGCSFKENYPRAKFVN